MTDIVYTVKRSSRRTLCVTILSDNTIVVKCPYKTSQKDIEKFVKSKENWILSHTENNRAKLDFLAEVISFKSVLVKGNFARLEICDRVFYSEELICVKSIKNLNKLYVKNLGGEFISLAENISSASKLYYKKLSFKDYKSRWGCCNKSGELTFNYKLLMLPKELWAYVILHELCHTVFMNHSKDFYALVKSFMPDYKKAVKALKSYAVLTRLY